MVVTQTTIFGGDLFDTWAKLVSHIHTCISRSLEEESMIYGHTVSIEGKIGTFVGAGDTLDEYDTWWKSAIEEDNPNVTEVIVPSFFDKLSNGMFMGYKHNVHVFIHNSEREQDAFIKEHNLSLGSLYETKDKHDDMIWQSKEDAVADQKKSRRELFEQRQQEINEAQRKWYIEMSNKINDLKRRRLAGEEIPPEDEIAPEDAVFYMENEYREVTIGEELGLDQHDPWDKRSDEEKELEKKMKEKFKNAQKSGIMSGESFTGPIARDRGGAKINLDDINDAQEELKEESCVSIMHGGMTINEDGTISGQVVAKKYGGEVDTDLLAEKENAIAERKATQRPTYRKIKKALVGDNSCCAAGIMGDRGKPKKTTAKRGKRRVIKIEQDK